MSGAEGKSTQSFVQVGTTTFPTALGPEDVPGLDRNVGVPVPIAFGADASVRAPLEPGGGDAVEAQPATSSNTVNQDRQREPSSSMRATSREPRPTAETSVPRGMFHLDRFRESCLCMKTIG